MGSAQPEGQASQCIVCQENVLYSFITSIYGILALLISSIVSHWLGSILRLHETEEMMFCGLPICVRTLSSHWRGPWRWTSTQQGVEVTSCLWYSAPQPFTKDILGQTVSVNIEYLYRTLLYTFLSVRTLPQTRGWLTEIAELRTPGYWKFSNCSREESCRLWWDENWNNFM